MLFSALRAHGNGKIHFSGSTREEQANLIDDLLTLQLNHFMGEMSEYPTYRSKEETRESVKQAFQLLSLYFIQASVAQKEDSRSARVSGQSSPGKTGMVGGSNPSRRNNVQTREITIQGNPREGSL